MRLTTPKMGDATGQLTIFESEWGTTVYGRNSSPPRKGGRLLCQCCPVAVSSVRVKNSIQPVVPAVELRQQLKSLVHQPSSPRLASVPQQSSPPPPLSPPPLRSILPAPLQRQLFSECHQQPLTPIPQSQQLSRRPQLFTPPPSCVSTDHPFTPPPNKRQKRCLGIASEEKTKCAFVGKHVKRPLVFQAVNFPKILVRRNSCVAANTAVELGTPPPSPPQSRWSSPPPCSPPLDASEWQYLPVADLMPRCDDQPLPFSSPMSSLHPAEQPLPCSPVSVSHDSALGDMSTSRMRWLSTPEPKSRCAVSVFSDFSSQQSCFPGEESCYNNDLHCSLDADTSTALSGPNFPHTSFETESGVATDLSFGGCDYDLPPHLIPASELQEYHSTQYF